MQFPFCIEQLNKSLTLVLEIPVFWKALRSSFILPRRKSIVTAEFHKGEKT